MGRPNGLLQPAKSTSIWNWPLGSSWTPVFAGLPSRTKTAISAEKVVVNMDPTQPQYPVYKNTGQHDTNRCQGSGGLYVPSIVLPYNNALVVPQAGLNYPGCFIDPDGITLWEAGNVAAFCKVGSVQYELLTAGHILTLDTIAGELIAGASGGSGISTFGGLIRSGEFASGVIPHALRFNLDGHTDLSDNSAGFSAGETAHTAGYRWPATSHDGWANPNNVYSGVVPASTMGSLYALLPTFNVAALLTVPGRIIATALQNYGGYVCNDSVSNTWAMCTELSAVGDVTSEFQTLYGFHFAVNKTDNNWGLDCDTILTNLYVVDSNTAAQYATNVASYGYVSPGNENPTSSWIGAGGGVISNPALVAADIGTTGTNPFIQDLDGSAPSGTLVPVPNGLTIAGSTLVLIVEARGASTPTIGISGGGTWVQRAINTTASNNGKITGWELVPGSPVAANTIQIALSVSSSVRWQFYEIPASLAGVFEFQNTAGGGSVSPSITSSPVNPTDLIIDAFMWTGVETVSALPATPWNNE